MDQEIVERLLALNRAFYADFARAFASSRLVDDPALTSILPYIPERARVLDVGCGNGRLAWLLDRERPGSTYVGIDAVSELIEVALAASGSLANVTAAFHVVDVARPGWGGAPDLVAIQATGTGAPEPSDPARRFDCIVCLAVLHHIPSFDLRLRVVQEMAGLLAAGGTLVLSTWQFLSSARMRRKIVEWGEVDVSEQALEPGDYLLDWKRGGRGLRYCHLVDEAEVRRLVADSGLDVQETFRAGGREGNLSLFAILGR